VVRRRAGVRGFCFLGCRSTVFWPSSSCTGLTGGISAVSGSSPPSGLPRVAATRRSGARGRVRSGSLGVRSTAFGSFPPRTRRSVGFTGIFRVVSGWFWAAPSRVVSTRRRRRPHVAVTRYRHCIFFFVIRDLGVSCGFFLYSGCVGIGFLLGLGVFFCILEGFIVSWVFFVFWGFTIASWVFGGGFYCTLGLMWFWGLWPCGFSRVFYVGYWGFFCIVGSLLYLGFFCIMGGLLLYLG
jgi:hypothetical protein